MRVVFAGGGTGGHVYPAMAVAAALEERVGDFRPLFVGTRSGLEGKVLPGTGWPVRFIVSRGVRGRGPVGKLLTMAGLSIGVLQSLRLLAEFKPDLVFGAGGYASAAVVLAAAMLRRRIVLQEQNSIPGMTNRMLARFADRVYLGFEKAASFFGDHRGIAVTGNPLRRSLLERPEGATPREFGLDERRPTLLVFGGSQGARTLNTAVIDYLLEHEGVQAIIQTGEQDYERVVQRMSGIAGRVHASAFITDIHRAYGAADLAVARAGALSVSELAAVGLPAVLVPYPYAADDHQVYNAGWLVDAGGAVMIRDDELSGGTLAAVIDPLLGSPDALERMRAALVALAPRPAADLIADDIVRLCGPEHRRSRERGGTAPAGWTGGGKGNDRDAR